MFLFFLAAHNSKRFILSFFVVKRKIKGHDEFLISSSFTSALTTARFLGLGRGAFMKYLS